MVSDVLSLGSQHLLRVGVACIHQQPSSACELLTRFQVQVKVMAGSSPLGGGTPLGPLWGDFRLVQLSGSFRLKTLGLSPPTVLWPLTSFCAELWAPSQAAQGLGREAMCESMNECE